MDRYADRMIARGPTLDGDGTPTGSVHVLDLPDPGAARTLLTPDRYAAIEVHTWRFGGRVTAGPAT